MCKELGVTPRGLGKLRREDPQGIEFMEQHMIHQSNEIKKHSKK